MCRTYYEHTTRKKVEHFLNGFHLIQRNLLSHPPLSNLKWVNTETYTLDSMVVTACHIVVAIRVEEVA